MIYSHLMQNTSITMNNIVLTIGDMLVSKFGVRMLENILYYKFISDKRVLLLYIFGYQYNCIIVSD